MNIATERLLPHRPPMRFIDSLTRCDENGACATVRFSPDSFAVCDGLVTEAALVECVAQTVAAALAYAAQTGQPPGLGMLAAVTNFQIHSQPAAEKLLEIEIRERKRLGPMRLVAGTITCDGQLIAAGELTVYA